MRRHREEEPNADEQERAGTEKRKKKQNKQKYIEMSTNDEQIILENVEGDRLINFISSKSINIGSMYSSISSTITVLPNAIAFSNFKIISAILNRSNSMLSGHRCVDLMKSSAIECGSTQMGVWRVFARIRRFCWANSSKCDGSGALIDLRK